MNETDFKKFMRAAIKPYYWGFLTKPDEATLTIETNATKTWAELKVAQSDQNKIELTSGLKPHLSAVFNRLSRDVDSRDPQGLFLV